MATDPLSYRGNFINLSVAEPIMSYGNGGGFDPDQPQGGGRAYPQSYNDPSVRPQPPKSSNRTLFWILGIVSFITVGGAIACCGLGYFGIQMATKELATQFRGQIENSPEVAEHIGDVEDMTLSFQAMQQAGEAAKLVFEIKGTKGSGQVSVDLSKAEGKNPEEAFELVLPDGQRIPLTGVKDDELDFEISEPDAESESSDESSDMDDPADEESEDLDTTDAFDPQDQVPAETP
jgi:hypothetical protein